jgi:hypothetical protein
MTAGELISQYETARRLLSRFLGAAKHTGKPVEFVAEPDIRINQLRYLLNRRLRCADRERPSPDGDARRHVGDDTVTGY